MLLYSSKIFLSVAPPWADYRAATVAPEKIKKQATQGDELTIKMVKNPDIVAGVAALKRPSTLRRWICRRNK
ncbi:bifunctional phosphopantothenoylcysteine decarboxylase/phosphopantothenate synthase [Escherichia coli]|uniref:Bifunctional phosphopantothenoylcysteine decarboxylase/phosphopantothenate synthase n=1 Tax=Escherichia coli TaxID=562 RepID=A0A2X1J5K8_ECOLX|nr:bifunctional phosphopantothenoylcysteine decarboxylase/phosphopantothenate synthase [Escherichia coli]